MCLVSRSQGGWEGLLNSTSVHNTTHVLNLLFVLGSDFDNWFVDFLRLRCQPESCNTRAPVFNGRVIRVIHSGGTEGDSPRMEIIVFLIAALTFVESATQGYGYIRCRANLPQFLGLSTH